MTVVFCLFYFAGEIHCLGISLSILVCCQILGNSIFTGSDLDFGKTTTCSDRKSCDPLHCTTSLSHMVIFKLVIGHHYHFLSHNAAHVQTGSHVTHCIAAFLQPVIGHYCYFLSHDPDLYIVMLQGSSPICCIDRREYTSKYTIQQTIYRFLINTTTTTATTTTIYYFCY